MRSLFEMAIELVCAQENDVDIAIIIQQQNQRNASDEFKIGIKTQTIKDLMMLTLHLLKLYEG